MRNTTQQPCICLLRRQHPRQLSTDGPDSRCLPASRRPPPLPRCTHLTPTGGPPAALCRLQGRPIHRPDRLLLGAERQHQGDACRTRGERLCISASETQRAALPLPRTLACPAAAASTPPSDPWLLYWTCLQIKNGGQHSPALDRKCTHLVTNSTDSDKYRCAACCCFLCCCACCCAATLQVCGAGVVSMWAGCRVRVAW